jgi:hypothetical protein
MESNQYLSYQSDCTDCGEFCSPLNIPKNGCTNSGFNFGTSTNLVYDPCYINDDIEQSTAPLLSILDPNRVKSCDQCLSLFGPRASHNGWGDSIPIENPGLTPAQELVDIDSIMSNRNVKQSRCKRGKVNDIDVFKFKTYDAKVCNRTLDPLSSVLTYPKQLYREMSINRFYDLNLNPQKNIYYDWAVNSKLEATDNYDNPYPYFLNIDNTLPTPITGERKQCKEVCPENTDTSVNVYNRNTNSFLQ